MLRAFGGGYKPKVKAPASGRAGIHGPDPMAYGKSADSGSGEAHDRGVAVQACVQCGLSIGEAATFCPVCGSRVGDAIAVATAVEPGAPHTPGPDPEVGAGAAPEARESDVAEPEAETLPGPEPAAELVSELEPDERTADSDPEAARLDAVPVTGHGTILEAGPDAHAELVADLASEHQDGAATEAPAVVEPFEELEAPAAEEPEAAPAAEETPAAEAEESPEDVRQRQMTEIAALLEFAGRCEEVNAARAAVVYGEAIVACLDVTGDPLDDEPVRKDLLRGFDGLSLVLERQGLPEEALAVVDDAASLGLLDGADGAAASQQTPLRDRRESLRHILYGDSAQL
jgi:hypothetical protein